MIRFTLQTLDRPRDGLGHFLELCRFDQIVHCLQLNGFFGIFKLGISAHDDAFCFAAVLLQGTDQIKPVQAGHPNICQDNVRIRLKNPFQRLFAVVCRPHDLYPRCVPIDHGRQRFHHELFVIRYKKFIQDMSPLHSPTSIHYTDLKGNFGSGTRNAVYADSAVLAVMQLDPFLYVP
ncbi:hypothetical protein D3C74_369940 [compost metagenome]